MKDRERLEKLLEQSEENNGLFAVGKNGKQVGQGYVPVHYKRCTIEESERSHLAKVGLREILITFDEQLFYTQALIAGAVLSGEYNKIGIISPSQYGKSFLMGMIALCMAYNGHKVNVAASTADKTDIIMRYCLQSAAKADPAIKKALTSESVKKVDRLDQSMSKSRLSFPGRGSVQGLTLGETFSDLGHNKAIGESGAWLVDEAALASSASLSEVGRREFSSVDGSVEPLIMISNPHNPGYFYDFITKEKMKPGECVIWMDALTGVQEGRWSKEKVLSSEFIDHSDTLQRYLLCELPSTGAGMFDEPKVMDRKIPEAVRVMGVDAAYKGKDNIEICLCEIGAGDVHISAVETIKKPVWIDGVTSQDIIEQVSKVYHASGCSLCCVDEGWGVWLKEGLVLHGVNAKGVNFSSKPTKVVGAEKVRRYAAVNAANMRAEMHLDLADLIEHQAITFSEQAYKRIEDVLPLIISERKPNGLIQIIPKPEVKAKLGHSPDAFDAVLLAVHGAVMYCEGQVVYMKERNDA